MATQHDAILRMKLRDQTKGGLSRIKNQLIGIGAAYLGWKAVTGILSSIVKAGKEHEKAWNDVAASLKRHGFEIDQNLMKIQDFSDQMQTLSGISDEVIGKSVQGFMDFGQTVEEAMDTTRVAMDLAAGSGIEMRAATDLLAKAAVGYTGTLSRYGIIIDESIPKAEKFRAAIEQINDKFAGAAAARVDTFAVKIAVLSERFGDLQEQLFKVISPVLLTVVEGLANEIEQLTRAFEPTIVALQRQQREFKNTSKSSLELADRYDELASKTVLTASEQDEFSRILKQLTTDSPDVITAWNDQGEAISANTVHLRENIEAQRALLVIKATAELKSIGEEWLRLKDKIKETAAELSDGGPQRLSVTNWGGTTKAIGATVEKLDALKEKQEEQVALAKIMFPALIEGSDRYKIAIRLLGEEFTQLVIKQQENLANSLATNEERLELMRIFTDEDLNIRVKGFEAETHELKVRTTAQIMLRQAVTRKGIEDWKAFFKAFKDMQNQQLAAVVTFGQQAGAVFAQWMNNSVDRMLSGQAQFRDIFKDMANDFISFFIKKALAAITLLFIPGLRGILGSIFDTAANDRMAAEQGQHFAQFFIDGALGTIASANLGLGLVGAAGSFQGINAPLAGAGGGGVTIVFNGPVTSEQYIEETVAPLLQRAISEDKTSMIVEPSNITGDAEIRVF